MLDMIIYFLDLEATARLLKTRKGMILLVFRLLLCHVTLICSSVLQDCSDFRFSIIFDILRQEKVSWNSQFILREQILQTDIVHKQLSKHLFAPNGGY